MSYFTDRLFELSVPEGSDDRAMAGFVATCDRRFQIRLTADGSLILAEWIPTGLCYRQYAGGLRSETLEGFAQLMRDPNGFASNVTSRGVDSNMVVREPSGPGRSIQRLKDLMQVELAVLESLEKNVWYQPEKS